MKTRILCFLMLLIATSSLSTVNAQFWDGFLYGLINGLSNAAARQTYSNSYNNSSSYKNSSSSSSSSSTSSSIEKEYEIENDGFTWYELSKKVNGDWKYGIANSNGTTLISPQYDLVYWHPDKYFKVINNGYDGAVSKSGKVIIEPNKYKSLIYVGGTFKYQNSSGEWISLNIDNEGNKLNNSTTTFSSNSSKSPFADGFKYIITEFTTDRDIKLNGDQNFVSRKGNKIVFRFKDYMGMDLRMLSEFRKGKRFDNQWECDVYNELWKEEETMVIFDWGSFFVVFFNGTEMREFVLQK